MRQQPVWAEQLVGIFDDVGGGAIFSVDAIASAAGVTRKALKLADSRGAANITFDNDTAFAQHGLLRKMRDMATWFCDAYASWQKGGIENANGRLRRWLPRHLDIDRGLSGILCVWS